MGGPSEPVAQRCDTSNPEIGHNKSFGLRVASYADGVVAEFLAGFCGHTYAAYRADLTDFFSYCTSTNLDPLQVTRGQVAGYLNHLSAVGRSPATVARRLVALRGFYELAVAEYGLTVSPVNRIRYRRVRNQTRIRALTGHQLAAFLQAADQSPARATGLGWLIATTGLRVSEACAAKTTDLRPGERPGQWWLDVECKGDLRRTIPVHAATWQRLKPLIADSAGPIFTTREDRQLDRHTAARDLARVATGAGIPGRFSPHLLRHTFVTLARQTGCPLEDVQDAVGHADPATTRRYDQTLLQHANHPGARILTALSALTPEAASA